MSLSIKMYIGFLESLTPTSLNQLEDYVTTDVHFRDPFNDVHGLDAMSRVFTHMFENVEGIHFHVETSATSGEACFLEWQYDGILRGQKWSFKGTSVIRFTDEGRVYSHIDYWDAAGNFYERLPIIGPIIRRIRRHLAVR